MVRGKLYCPPPELEARTRYAVAEGQEREARAIEDPVAHGGPHDIVPTPPKCREAASDFGIDGERVTVRFES